MAVTINKKGLGSNNVAEIIVGTNNITNPNTNRLRVLVCKYYLDRYNAMTSKAAFDGKLFADLIGVGNAPPSLTPSNNKRITYSSGGVYNCEFGVFNDATCKEPIMTCEYFYDIMQALAAAGKADIVNTDFSTVRLATFS